MKRFLTSTFALLVLTTGPADAVNACDKGNAVRAAFEPRLVFEQARATRVGSADWSRSVRSGFERIAQQPGDCAQLFGTYQAYLEQVIQQNDSFEKARDRGRIFKKW